MTTIAKLGISLVAVAAATLVVPQPTHAQSSNGYENLQVFPADISRDDLIDAMLMFSRALGLPRRAGAGCLHCHVGDLSVPRGEWDYASDAKPTKRVARQMVEMTRAINAQHLAGLEVRRLGDFQVGCVTCHEGRVDPRPLPLLIAEADLAGGVDSVETIYRTIHSRYFGGSAYDLRVSVLAGMAQQRAEEGAFDEAIRLSMLNEETHPTEPSARRVTLSLHLMRALDTQGVEEALAVFDRFAESEDPDVFTYSILDGVGWRTYRLDRQDEAMPLFRRNRETFPDLYFTFESLVEAQRGVGEITVDEIIAAYEEYLEANPGHTMAQQQLTNHRRRR